jgi:hypothetical protein
VAVSDLFNAVIRAWRRMREARVAVHAPPTDEDQANALAQMTAPLESRPTSKGGRRSSEAEE